MPSRYWIACGLGAMGTFAAVVATFTTFWLLFAVVPFALGALACLAPRPWLSNDAYRRSLNVLAYASIIPAAVAIVAAVGVTYFLLLALPALLTFVFVMWQTKTPAAE
jgi:hypothetical protein